MIHLCVGMSRKYLCIYMKYVNQFFVCVCQILKWGPEVTRGSRAKKEIQSGKFDGRPTSKFQGRITIFTVTIKGDVRPVFSESLHS